MFDCRNHHIALLDYCAALCSSYIVGYSLDYGLLWEVDALDSVASVGWSRVECHCDIETCMQTFA